MRWEDAPKDLKPPTDQEAHASCIRNAQEAAANERTARRLMERYQPGEERFTQAMLDARRFRSDQRHWNDVAEWYRARMAQEAPRKLTPPVMEWPATEEGEELPW